MKRQPASGFTLLELLAVIAIVSIAVAIFLPAVQQARAAMRRANCLSNLRQIALSVASYESTNGRFPSPGNTLFDEDGIAMPHTGNQISWAVHVLPFLEEGGLYDRFSMSTSVFDQPDVNAANEQPSILLCPADNALGRLFSFDENVTVAKANYAAWSSPNHMEDHRIYPGAISGAGAKGSSVTDGLSKTFLASEVRTRSDTNDPRGIWAASWSGGSLLSADGHPEERGYRYSPFAKRFYAVLTPNHRNLNYDVIFRCDAKPAREEEMPCVTYKAGSSHGYYQAAPRSLHANGVNIVYMDGHAKFVTDDIDPILMALLVCTNDGRQRSDFPTDLKAPTFPSF